MEHCTVPAGHETKPNYCSGLPSGVPFLVRKVQIRDGLRLVSMCIDAGSRRRFGKENIAQATNGRLGCGGGDA